MDKLINHLKNIRKRSYIGMSYNSKFAFVGIGNHSINNLYPVINYLKLDLKYIVTSSEANAKIVDDSYKNTEGTNDLDKVLADAEVAGVFICASPKAHFGLVKRVLEADKNVFVEKPPCLSLSELKELIEVEKESKGTCIVGFQKQYAPSNIELKKQAKNKCSYNYRFVAGAYPEGDPFLDMFIHPISLLTFMFGNAELKFVSNNKSKAGVTTFLSLTHKNGTSGIIELSTDYSWTNATEKMIVNTNKGFYELTNTEELIFTSKQGTLLGIPKEKIFGDKMTQKTLAKRNNFNPIFDNNQLFTSGYYTEIDSFVKLCENKKSINNSSLQSCINLYELLETIKNN